MGYWLAGTLLWFFSKSYNGYYMGELQFMWFSCRKAYTKSVFDFRCGQFLLFNVRHSNTGLTKIFRNKVFFPNKCAPFYLNKKKELFSHPIVRHCVANSNGGFPLTASDTDRDLDRDIGQQSDYPFEKFLRHPNLIMPLSPWSFESNILLLPYTSHGIYRAWSRNAASEILRQAHLSWHEVFPMKNS